MKRDRSPEWKVEQKGRFTVYTEEVPGNERKRSCGPQEEESSQREATPAEPASRRAVPVVEQPVRQESPSALQPVPEETRPVEQPGGGIVKKEVPEGDRPLREPPPGA
ncbi:unnamed protein product [Spirodela intermedia]|uniref:Uncharacterized protein n=1 Tax=Spirodela intermedia TaxID=51605 RepID=A0A7I8LMU7_SPIIN|nr:unnamed protein product [Spirodela intermedia]